MLLIDEVDKTDVEVEGLLLEVLSDFQVTIPELGTVDAPYAGRSSCSPPTPPASSPRRSSGAASTCTSTTRTPSASARSSARRCPDLEETVAEQLVAAVGRLRDLELKKAPSIAESVDWARTLIALEIDDLDEAADREHARRRPQARLRPRPCDPGARAAAAGPYERRGLVDRHIAFLEALRGAGLPVSLAEDLDAVAALARARLGRPRDRAHARTPPRWSSGRAQRPDLRHALRPLLPAAGGRGRGRRRPGATGRRRGGAVRDNAQALADFRERARRGAGRRATRRRSTGSPSRRSAGSARCPAGARGCRRWSAYTALQRVSPAELIEPDRRRRCWPRDAPRTEAGARPRRRVGGFTRLVEDDARRRIAEEKGPDHVAERRGAADHRPARLHRRARAPTSRRCAARSTRWPGGWPPG